MILTTILCSVTPLWSVFCAIHYEKFLYDIHICRVSMFTGLQLLFRSALIKIQKYNESACDN